MRATEWITWYIISLRDQYYPWNIDVHSLLMLALVSQSVISHIKSTEWKYLW